MTTQRENTMSIKNLNDKQRKVYEACRNGWLVGGEYRAKFDNRGGTSSRIPKLRIPQGRRLVCESLFQNHKDSAFWSITAHSSKRLGEPRKAPFLALHLSALGGGQHEPQDKREARL